MDITPIIYVVAGGAVSLLFFFLKIIYSSNNDISKQLKNMSERLVKLESQYGNIIDRLVKVEQKQEALLTEIQEIKLNQRQTSSVEIAMMRKFPVKDGVNELTDSLHKQDKRQIGSK